MFTPNKFAWQSIIKNRFCSLMFLCLVGIASACIYGVGFFNKNISSGIGKIKGQINADIIAVPSDYNEDAKNTLFAGNACTILFKNDPRQQFMQENNIEQLSTQLYMETLSFSCCSEAGVQIIAFDPKTDFTVRNWTDSNIDDLAADEMIVGASCGLKKGSSMELYGRTFTAAEVLEESGMGYDQSIFISYDAADQITASKDYDILFHGKQGLSSMVLIKAAKGCDTDEIRNSLSDDLSGVSLYSTDSLVSEVRKQADGFKVTGTIMNIFVVLLAAVALFALITVNFYQRKKRVGSLLSVGITRSRIIKIFFLEYFYLTLLGTIIGIGSAAVFIMPLHQIIKRSVDLPYRMISFSDNAVLCLTVFGINLLMLLSACSLTFTKIIRTEPAILSEEQI